MILAILLRKGILLSLLMAFGILSLPAFGCSSAATLSNVAPKVGQPAPFFEIRLVGGDIIKTEELLGDTVILNFWATWCGPCRRELPLLERIAVERGTDNLHVIAVNMGEPEEVVREFVREFDLKLPVALDADGRVSRLYGVPALPTTFFIDYQGVVQYRRVGELREGHVTTGLSRVGYVSNPAKASAINLMLISE